VYQRRLGLGIKQTGMTTGMTNMYRERLTALISRQQVLARGYAGEKPLVVGEFALLHQCAVQLLDPWVVTAASRLKRVKVCDHMLRLTCPEMSGSDFSLLVTSNLDELVLLLLIHIWVHWPQLHHFFSLHVRKTETTLSKGPVRNEALEKRG